jgi:tRNA modification GTPase
LLVRAPTARTAAILLDQWCGAWDGLRHRDVPGGAAVGPDPRPLSAKERAEIQKLRALIPLGRHLVEPWTVVLAGAPNVGKSSLMNALAGYSRSIVAPSPGTTRDLVTVQLAIDGWPIEMTDTAGLREATSDLERQGIQRTHDVLHEADLRLWLLDGAIRPVVPDNPAGWCFVINKTDLPAGWDWARIPDAVRVSAHTQAGLPDLCALISRQLVPNPPAPGEAVPCLPEQVEQVEGA